MDVTALLAAVLLSQHQPALFREVGAKDESYVCETLGSETEAGLKVDRYRLTSQVWKGRKWEHGLEIHHPLKVEVRGTALLFITGDRGRLDPDAKLAKEVAAIAGMPVAVLYDVPNQPLFRNLREDELIAFTFGEFLKTKDETWPLLVPMTKSSVWAMTAICEQTAKSENPVRRFLVSGESKRGWTALLTAAYDQRVIGVAALGFDMIDMPAQLKRQKQLWGGYSPMFAAYEPLDPGAVAESELGKLLLSIVDPTSYLPRLHRTKLIMRGTNDPFWTADATSVYWDSLPGGKLCSYLPNVGHVVSTEASCISNLGLFCRIVATESQPPLFRGSWTQEGRTWSFTPVAPGAKSVKLWVANSRTNDFSKSEWRVVAQGHGRLEVPNFGEPTAAMVEATFTIGSQPLTLTTIPRILSGASDRLRSR